MPPVPSAGAVVDEVPAVDGGGATSLRGGSVTGERRLPARWVTAGLLALLALPLVVAVVALRRPQWFPILDLAMTELRVRDVGTRNTPLIGLPGRIGVLGEEQGSHPGPLSFWFLAPTYRLFGSSAWAMQVATAVLHTVAMGTALWLAHRRGGLRLVLGVAVLLAVLTRAYGAATLTEPWNPYMPLLWWVVLLLVGWSLLDRDVAVLPVGAFAATMCVQTHAPYSVVSLGISGLAVAGAGYALWSWRGDRRRQAQALRWVLVAAAVGAALWTAPVVDQLTRSPGNISLLVDHFGSPPEDSVGLGRGVEMTLLHLDPWRLVTEQQAATGSLVDASQAPRGPMVPGALMLVVWGAAVLVAWRLRHGLLLRLHLVVGVALVLAVLSISRIFGQLWYYLMIWAWGITALLLLATVWTAAAWVHRRLDPAARVRAGRAGAGALLAAVVASTAVFAVDAVDTELPALPLSRTMAGLVPDAVDALEQGEVAGGGRDGRYLVTWSDALYIGSQGIALVNELERHGLDVGAIEPWGVPVARHRVRAPADATAVVHLATGFHVERWRAKEGVEEIAYVEPRSPAEQREYERIRASVIDDLRAAGVEDRLVDVDENLFAVAIDGRVPPSAQDGMTRMLDLGLPTAIFVGPVSAMD
jgi:hypothetical protein